MGITRRDFTRATLATATVTAIAGSPAIAGPEQMITKKIPSSGEAIPVIGLGTNRYGVDGSEAARAPLREALRRFHQLGGTVIDTAPMYRTSENVLGDLIAGLDIRDDLFIATKSDKTGGRAETDEQMHESLRKLETKMVELMQVHNLLGWQDALPVMREWKEEGRVRYIGITTSRENQYDEFEQVMRSGDLEFIQVNYSLEQRKSAERLLPLAADRGIAVIINRAFGGGRLFEKVGEQPLPDWAADFDCTSWAQFLLNYAVSHPAATVAIPGMTKVHHVDDNMGTARGRLPNAKERAKMEQFFDDL